MAMAALVVPVVVVSAAPAGACGGLVGENGTIELVRTTTLAAYSDGVERYVTAFEFTGEGEEVGSIVPLPDVPTEVTRAGDWTLQRLVQEVTPVPESDGEADFSAEASAPASTSSSRPPSTPSTSRSWPAAATRSGSGRPTTASCSPRTPPRSSTTTPTAAPCSWRPASTPSGPELGQGAGDSTPIMATIPTDDPWVPVRILGLGLEGDRTVEADVFLLTDEQPELLAGGSGLDLDRSEPARDLLLDDLRSDVGMGWVPEEMWLTYMTIDAPARELDYDLAVSATPASPRRWSTPGWARGAASRCCRTPPAGAVAAGAGRPAPGWPWACCGGTGAGGTSCRPVTGGGRHDRHQPRRPRQPGGPCHPRAGAAPGAAGAGPAGGRLRPWWSQWRRRPPATAWRPPPAAAPRSRRSGRAR